MSRETREQWARETLTICDSGSYVSSRGQTVNLVKEISQAKAGTVLYLPESPPAPGPHRSFETKIELLNETTFSAIKRLAPHGGHVACLNFASARNPGGGFLGGAQAQEESLARASALYPCLLMQPEYYRRNRENRSALYLDLAIFSPDVPFFRDDSGTLLDEPVLASVITAPAPNAGAVAHSEPQNMGLIEPALCRRSDLVLRTAQSHVVDTLVLGAWGCGVFGNDPEMVARIFSDLLLSPGPFAGAFSEVVFAVYDRSEAQATYKGFERVFPSE